MANEKPQPSSFSVLIADAEAELQQILKTVHFVASNRNLTLHEEIENRIKRLVQTIKILKKLKSDGWELSPCPTSHDYVLISPFREATINLELIRHRVVGDVAELVALTGRGLYSYCMPEDVFLIDLPKGESIYIKAKHLPLPQPQNLQKVTLADGNVAWLTPETLKAIKDLLANK